MSDPTSESIPISVEWIDNFLYVVEECATKGWEAAVIIENTVYVIEQLDYKSKTLYVRAK